MTNVARARYKPASSHARRFATVFRPSFQFLDPGRQRDGELELVAPHEQWVDEMVLAMNHPVTLATEPHEPRVSRQQLLDYLEAVPAGHMPADRSKGHVPHYDFWMLVHDFPPESGGPPVRPPLRLAGTITLRIGRTPALERYYGHVGYHVYPPARGRHFAERGCRLLLPLARRHGLRTLWITCDPANAASRRTCERLGMEYVETVDVPPADPLYARGEHQKCRYRLDL
jgi:predicted acetyltransferase